MTLCHDCNNRKSCVKLRQSDLHLCDNCELLRQVNPPIPGSAPRHLQKSNTNATKTSKTSKMKDKTSTQTPPVISSTTFKCTNQNCSVKNEEATCCCFICQSTFHLTCVGLSRRPAKSSNWCCKNCINFPTVIRKMFNDLNSLSASHDNLKTEMTKLRLSHETILTENNKLRNELELLKQGTSVNADVPSDEDDQESYDDVSKSSFKCLIVGDSIVKTFSDTSFEDTDIKSISGATVSDVFNELNHRDDLSSFSDIVLHAGTNDISKNIAIDDSVSSLEAAVTLIMVKAPTANVHISAVCPRTKGQVQHKVETLNVAFQDLASRLDCKFIDSNLFMTYRNGSVDDSQLRDGLHLSDRGHETLSRLFTDSIEGLKPGNWSRVPSKTQHIPSKPSQDRRHESQEPSRHSHNRTQGHRPRNSGRGRNMHQRNSHRTAHHGNDRSYKGCFNCGLKNHNKDTCFHENRVKCHKCNKLGHKANYCRN